MTHNIFYQIFYIRDGTLVYFYTEKDVEELMKADYIRVTVGDGFAGYIKFLHLTAHGHHFIKDFCEVVLDGKTMAAPPEFSLGELRTALALYKSIKSGTWEKVW